MQKAIKVKIKDIVLNIEEEASLIFENYLNSVRQHFLKYKDGDEIISDIETRIAEKASRLLKDKDDIISKAQIEKVIKEMGDVNEMDEANLEEHISVWNNLKYRLENFKLLRDTANQQIAGVCAGLGMYFNIDPVVVRFIFGILFVAGIFFNFQLSFFVSAIYILLWIAMPAAKTPVQRLEMKGENVTLAKIEEEIKLDKELTGKAIGTIAKIANELQSIVSRMYTKSVSIIKVLIRITAYLSIIPILLFVFGATIIYFMLMMDPNLSGLGEAVLLPLEDQDQAVKYVIITLGYVTAIIPAYLAFMASLSIIKKRSLFKPVLTIIAVLMWILVSAGLVAFGYNTRERYIQSIIENQENYTIVEKSYDDIDWEKVENIYISGNFNVVFGNNPVQSLLISSNKYSWDDIEVSYTDKRLVITRKRPPFYIPELNSSSSIIHLNINELSGGLVVDINGQIIVNETLIADEITLKGDFNGQELIVETQKLDLTAYSFYHSYVVSDPTITVSGKATEQRVTLYGRNYDASNLESEDVVINIYGGHSGLARTISKVKVSANLIARIWGDNDLEYIGNPEVVQHISGNAKITRVEL